MTIPNGGPNASVKMFYFQAEIVNFRDGIRTLKADQRGVYLSLLLEIYDCMGPILFDPKRLSLATGLDARLIARVVPELVALGKLYLADGWLHNSRAEKEIDDYVKGHLARSGTAKERESVKREKRTSEQSQIEELRKQLSLALSELKRTSALSPPQPTGDVCLSSALALGDVSETIQNNPAISTPTKHATATTRAREESIIYNLESKKEERKKEGRSLTFAACAASPASDATIAFDEFNGLATRIGLPVARSLTPQRQKLLTARMREHGGLQAWRLALANIERSAFLQGRNDRGWRCDLDFLLTASKFSKVVEGTYGNGAHAKPAAPVESSYERMNRLMGRTPNAAPQENLKVLTLDPTEFRK